MENRAKNLPKKPHFVRVELRDSSEKSKPRKSTPIASTKSGKSKINFLTILGKMIRENLFSRSKKGNFLISCPN